jgi:hypothetical protein
MAKFKGFLFSFKTEQTEEHVLSIAIVAKSRSEAIRFFNTYKKHLYKGTKVSFITMQNLKKNKLNKKFFTEDFYNKELVQYRAYINEEGDSDESF